MFLENVLRLLKLLPELFIPRNRPSRRARTLDDVVGLFREVVGPMAMDFAGVLAATFESDEGLETGELSDSYMRLTAIHEAGHAVLYLRLSPDRLLDAQIWNRRGRAGQVQVRAQPLDNRQEVADLIVTYYGGLVAEDLYIDGGRTDGCESDIQTATNLAIAYIDLFGCKKGAAPISHTILAQEIPLEGTVFAKKRAAAIVALLEASFQQAKDILQEERVLVIAIAEALLERRHLDREELLALHTQHAAKKA